MEGTASASPGLRQIVSRAPANSACRGRGPRPRRYAGGSVAPSWRPCVLHGAAARQPTPQGGSAAAAAAAAPLQSPCPRFGEPHHSSSLLGRRNRPTGGDGGGGGGGGGGAAATASTARAAYGHWALGILALGARHWALGLGPWHSGIGHWLGTLREIGRVVSWTGACAARRIAAPLSLSVLPPPRACEGSCYSPLTHRRHSSAAYAPSCLPQRLCASACQPCARRCPRWPDGHPVANKPAKRWGPGAANGCTASCARRLRRRSRPQDDAMKARRTVRPQRARVQALVQAWREPGPAGSAAGPWRAPGCAEPRWAIVP
jgi:hypothetical protein